MNMAVMTHEYSDFPERVYNLHHFENVANAPSDVIAVISEIKELIAAGSYSAAVALLENNKSILSRFIFTCSIDISEDIHKLALKKWVLKFSNTLLGFCWWLSSKDSAFNTGDRICSFRPQVWKIPWRRL